MFDLQIGYMEEIIVKDREAVFVKTANMPCMRTERLS